jgi:hypothetical protein
MTSGTRAANMYWAIMGAPAGRVARSAPRSGRGGRTFKSCYFDQHLAVLFDRAGTDCGTETDGRSHSAAARKSRSQHRQSAKNCDGDRRNAKKAA